MSSTRKKASRLVWSVVDSRGRIYEVVFSREAAEFLKYKDSDRIARVEVREITPKRVKIKRKGKR